MVQQGDPSVFGSNACFYIYTVTLPAKTVTVFPSYFIVLFADVGFLIFHFNSASLFYLNM